MLGGAAGLVMGAVAVAATRWSEHSGTHAEPEEPPLPRGVGDVLSVLRSIAVVVDASDAVVNTSASAAITESARWMSASSRAVVARLIADDARWVISTSVSATRSSSS